MKDKIKIGIYGSNGHQLTTALLDHPNAQLTALCGVSAHFLQGQEHGVHIYDTLEEMLADDRVELVSLCSPRRSDQVADAISCMRAGKHVYAEKPCALTEKELDAVLRVSEETGYEFHEMADTVFHEPYWTMRSLVRSGQVGEVVQVYVQKSYPLQATSRPQDQETDGGLIRWAGIHAIRFLEHITGVRVQNVQAVQTHKGNIKENEGLFTASSWMMTLENGAVASACVNYLNPRGFGQWGNETVRIFGTRGMIEVTDGGKHTHLYTEGADEGPIDCTNSNCRDFFDLYLEHLRYGTPMPMDRAEELHPLRVVIRAFESQ